jgi:hypothetical protein
MTLLNVSFVVVVLIFWKTNCAHSNRFVQADATTTTIVSLQSGWNKLFSKRWMTASSLASLEQQVEDYNAEYIARVSSSSSSYNIAGDIVKHRRLICLPLDERFDPPMGVFSHQHIQTGDKMSLPSCFQQAITLNHAEVPWLFRVRRIEGVTTERIQYNTNSNNNETNIDELITECKPLLELNEVVGGPLDFRAPSNYIFIPMWMMRLNYDHIHQALQRIYPILKRY